MLVRFWNYLSDKDNRERLTVIGGGGAAVVAALWTGAIYFSSHERDGDQKNVLSVAVSGQGMAVVGNTTINAPVTTGPTPEQIAEIQNPLVKQLSKKDEQIAALFTQLNNQRTTPAAPGADEALRGAATNIVQGAVKDPRYAQVEDFIKAGKTAEAQGVLRAIAEEKAQRSQAEAKSAAATYRDLGAIAGLRDPKTAREAYARAVALDPSNPDGLDWNGWFELEGGNLTGAAASYQRLLALEGKGASLTQVLGARVGLGDVAVARGNLASALAFYEGARDGFQKIVQADPNNAQAQRNLSVSLNNIGDVQVAQGALSEALASYSASRVIFERLAQSDPGNAGWQRDLSVSYAKLADVHLKAKRSSEAREALAAGRAIIARLVQQHPDWVEWKRDLVWFDEQLAALEPAH